MTREPPSSCSSGTSDAPATQVTICWGLHALCEWPSMHWFAKVWPPMRVHWRGSLVVDFQPNGALPVSASAVAPSGEVYTPKGLKPYAVPRALETEEIPGIVEQYRCCGFLWQCQAGSMASLEQACTIISLLTW